MRVILLSGGSGKRLWPLSNGVRSKQFLKILRDEKGQHESMIQRMIRNIKAVDNEAIIVIAAPESQIESIQGQVGDEFVISVEPEKRDTYPAIVLATSLMKEISHATNDDPVVIVPVDPLVDYGYFES